MFSNLSPFTKLHVIISLIGILSGLVVMCGLLAGQKLNLWSALFLISTVLTSVTGFFFPFHGVTPAIFVGIISLVLLAVAILARYALHLAGTWRRIYVVCAAAVALYLNVFVAVVQAFEKVAALYHELRRAKGLMPDEARIAVQDPLYYGNLLVRGGKADGSVAGATNTTARPGQVR